MSPCEDKLPQSSVHCKAQNVFTFCLLCRVYASGVTISLINIPKRVSLIVIILALYGLLLPDYVGLLVVGAGSLYLPYQILTWGFGPNPVKV